jgi:DNA-binding CsgD family transcriptional regulator
MGTPRNGKSHALRHGARLPPAGTEVGMVLLDLSLRPIAFDQGAATLFRDEVHRGGAAAPPFALPRELLDVIRRSKPTEGSSAKTRFRVGSREYTCRMYSLQSVNPSSQGSLLAVHLDREVSVTDALSEAGTEYRLTEREHEVLKQIAAGLTSKEVAERMNISPNTVKVFLRMIMMKMGVSTRSGVIAKLLEHADAR